MAQFDWVDFYKAFAKALLQYKDKRSGLIEIIKKVYEEIEINLPTLERDNQIVDIDPFTVFGLFNKSKLKESNRVKIITAFAKELSVDAAIPTSFDAVPVLNNQNATFYYWTGDRGPNDIDHLWDLFESALEYAKTPSDDKRQVVSKYFDLAINLKGNGNSKITMGLYWIAPDVYLNLDSRNTWYIYESSKIPADVVYSLPRIEQKISADKYFEIAERLQSYLQSERSALKDFKELSFEAWTYSEQVNQEERAAKVQSQRDDKGSALADEDVHKRLPGVLLDAGAQVVGAHVQHPAQGHQGQAQVHGKHDGQVQGDEEHRAHHLHQLGAHKGADHLHVGSTPLDDIPGGVGGVPGEGQALDVAEQRVPQPFHKPLRALGQIHPLAVGAHPPQGRHQQHRPRRDPQRPDGVGLQPRQVHQPLEEAGDLGLFLPQHRVHSDLDDLRGEGVEDHAQAGAGQGKDKKVDISPQRPENQGQLFPPGQLHLLLRVHTALLSLWA